MGWAVHVAPDDAVAEQSDIASADEGVVGVSNRINSPKIKKRIIRGGWIVRRKRRFRREGQQAAARLECAVSKMKCRRRRRYAGAV